MYQSRNPFGYDESVLQSDDDFEPYGFDSPRLATGWIWLLRTVVPLMLASTLYFAVLALGLFGWFIGKIVNGEIDVLGYLDSLYHRRGHPR